MHTRYCIRTAHMPLRCIRRSSLSTIRYHATQSTKARCFAYMISGR